MPSPSAGKSRPRRPIVAIADDLTGAAEIAAIGWRYGLRVRILRAPCQALSAADLIVIDTDSRHSTPAEAKAGVRRAAAVARRACAAWVYKKVDSVLRGNVLAEVRALQSALDLQRCLLVPCNPRAGRTIKAGRYFVDGVPISQTHFRNDPTHPRFSSNVGELLGIPEKCKTANPGGKHKSDRGSGLTVGEAASYKDVEYWSQEAGIRTLAAGGADFFTALLARRCKRAKAKQKKSARMPGLVWFLCGSLAEASFKFVETAEARGWPVFFLQNALNSAATSRAPDIIKALACKLVAASRSHQTVVLSIGLPRKEGQKEAARLGKALLAVVTRALAKKLRPEWLCVEGGATAALLLEGLGWTSVSVENEFAPGVVGVRARRGQGMLVVVKPGSYLWPDTVVGRLAGTPCRGSGKHKLLK